jgi:mono/diheme cytochrome c family protein
MERMARTKRAIGAAVIVVWGAVVAGKAAAPQQRGSAPGAVNYETEIQPLIVANCLDCHNADTRKGGLSLATYADILEGGKDGAVVKPGNGANSLLIHRLMGTVGEQMPREGVPLEEFEVALVRRWIDEGARATPTSPPAPAPWEAPLALTNPSVPREVWREWSEPADRIVASYLRERGAAEPPLVSDAVFARRVYLDLWGLLPSPEELDAFIADRTRDKRDVLVERLLADGTRYADHWISFWNDLLRNEDGVSYYSEQNGRRSISPWLLWALQTNLPYDRFVRDLLNPPAGGPEGFLIGVNWRGETSAAVTPWMQASQNTAQLFLGINLKCNSCHDSFVSKWKLKDAYGLAGYFAPEPTLQLFRCDVAQNEYATPAFLFPEIDREPKSSALADRRAAAAAIFTDKRNGRLSRTVVNRIWQRLIGHGIVANPDEMDGRPWSPVLLDWLARDFARHDYDLKHVIATIVRSRAYQMPAVLRPAEATASSYVFAGPEIRRLTAEQFADAVGSITGERSVTPLPLVSARGPRRMPAPAPGAGGRGSAPAIQPFGPSPSDALRVGQYAREWRNISSDLTRALGRPVRDQVTSVRATEPTTPQALELVNGEILSRWLQFGARRMLAAIGAEPVSLYNKAVAGRTARPVHFDIDIANQTRLWLLVRDHGSNSPGDLRPVWAQTEFVRADGTTVPLQSLTSASAGDLRAGPGTVPLFGYVVPALAVANPSTLIYDIGGRGFQRLRGVLWLENPTAEIGATLDPQIRFYVFAAEPDAARLRPAFGDGSPASPPPVAASKTAMVDRVFLHALGRPPVAAERGAAERALADPAGSERISVDGLADLLWAVLMKPEFQFIQ